MIIKRSNFLDIQKALLNKNQSNPILQEKINNKIKLQCFKFV